MNTKGKLGKKRRTKDQSGKRNAKSKKEKNGQRDRTKACNRQRRRGRKTCMEKSEREIQAMYNLRKCTALGLLELTGTTAAQKELQPYIRS
jgi:hypothetical protein